MTELIRVIRSTPMIRLQGGPRRGVGHYGVSACAASDPISMALVNRLLQQDDDTTCLEIALGGATLQFLADCLISIGGAQTRLMLDEQVVPMWRTLPIRAGQRLTLSHFNAGQYAYLACRGGFLGEQQLGSSSMSMREGIGTNRGQPFSAGQVIVGQVQTDAPIRTLPFAYRPRFLHQLHLPVVPGYQFRHLTRQVKQQFFQQLFVVSPQISRMGMRLTGSPLTVEEQPMASQGLGPGTIQLPPDGSVIVMGAEHQTLGGYPKLGAVLVPHLAALAQASPGVRVRFQLVSRAGGLQRIRAFYQQMDAIQYVND